MFALESTQPPSHVLSAKQYAIMISRALNSSITCIILPNSRALTVFLTSSGWVRSGASSCDGGGGIGDGGGWGGGGCGGCGWRW